MDPNSGRIYETEEEIAAAEARGEELIRLKEGVGRDLTEAEVKAINEAVKADALFKPAENRAQRRARQFGHSARTYRR